MYMNSEKKMGELSKYIYFIRFCFIFLHVTLRHNLRCSALFVALQIPDPPYQVSYRMSYGFRFQILFLFGRSWRDFR